MPGLGIQEAARCAPLPVPANVGRGGEDLVAALEAASSGIRDPVAKLRYIRWSLARYQKLDRLVRTVPWVPLRRWLYRWLSLEGLRHLLTPNAFGVPVAMDRRARRELLAGRAVTVAVILAVLASAATVAYRLSRAVALAGPLMARGSALPASAEGSLSPGALPPVAERLPKLPAGTAPSRVWMVENGAGWEQYSNGLRIDTTFALAGEPRRYHVFDREAGLQPTVYEKPVGILYHTSESDIWPLEASYNENLRDSSHGLLRYVKRLRLYNYLIDRFGRVFRVVEDETKANHAGASVWSQGNTFYLGLNNGFVGVCFESRWGGGQALPITGAQLAAGRSLTDLLRQRFEIAPEMCVTHGLTSVNPNKRLIGHHLDWARGFPFEAFGLPNLYDRPAPSVAVFGFSYDDEFLKVMGEPWAGVRDAERILADDARRQGRSLQEVRLERQGLYDRWQKEQTREEETRASASGRGQASNRIQPTSGG